MSVQSYAIPDNLPAPVTSGTTIQSFVDVTGEAWIAKNGVRSGNWYKARNVLHADVYRAGTYTTPTTYNVFGWDTDTASADPYGLYVGNPTYAFVVPIAGWYRFTASIGMAMNATLQWYAVQLWAGPTANVQLTHDLSFGCGLASGNLFVRGTALYYAAANDQLATKHAANVSGATGLLGTVNNSFFIEYQGTG